MITSHIYYEAAFARGKKILNSSERRMVVEVRNRVLVGRGAISCWMDESHWRAPEQRLTAWREIVEPSHGNLEVRQQQSDTVFKLESSSQHIQAP